MNYPFDIVNEIEPEIADWMRREFLWSQEQRCLVKAKDGKPVKLYRAWVGADKVQGIDGLERKAVGFNGKMYDLNFILLSVFGVRGA
jgi:hypothetical protein